LVSDLREISWVAMMITLQMRMIDDAELYAVEIGQSRLEAR